MSGPMHNGVNTIAQGRRHAMLRTAMGPQIAAALADPLVLDDDNPLVERRHLVQERIGERRLAG